MAWQPAGNGSQMVASTAAHHRLAPRTSRPRSDHAWPPRDPVRARVPDRGRERTDALTLVSLDLLVVPSLMQGH